MEFNLGAVQTASHPPPQSPTSASHNKWPRSQSPRSCQRSASIFLDCLQWVGCRRQTTKTQWPLVVVERPARWETAEAARQRPHQIDSSPSRPSGHWQPPTHSRRAGPPHSDDILSFVIIEAGKIVNIHGLMQIACKPLRNQVYSRLLGDRNDGDEGGKPDVLLEGSGRPAQTEQRHAA